VVSFTGGGNPGYYEKDIDCLAGQHQVFVLVPLPFLYILMSFDFPFVSLFGVR
jgi:hypothetical protein